MTPDEIRIAIAEENYGFRDIATHCWMGWRPATKEDREKGKFINIRGLVYDAVPEYHEMEGLK